MFVLVLVRNLLQTTSKDMKVNADIDGEGINMSGFYPENTFEHLFMNMSLAIEKWKGPKELSNKEKLEKYESILIKKRSAVPSATQMFLKLAAAALVALVLMLISP